MSFANQNNTINSNQIDKTKLLFGKELNRDLTQSSPIRDLLLGGSSEGVNLLSPLLEDGGIILEYSPSMQITYSSSYTSSDLTHANYDIQSYSRSTLNEIILSVKLTSETLAKADKTLAIMHFLRSFSKMNFGVNDPQKGTPPRLLKFYAYGDYMIHNVPVVIKNFTLDLQNTVDYVQTSFNTQVPLSIDFTVNLSIMPTPSKLKNDFSLQDFIDGKLVKKGYL